MKRKSLLLMMLLALFSSGAWAQFSGGSGSESNPYLISSSTDWNTLASRVNSGTSYSGQYFKMTSNITISGSTQNYMVGTMSGETNSGYAFSGNFNGDGHTITISYSTSSGFYYTAPFRYISGATIKNVKVAGTMNVYKFMGSLVGYCLGTNNIENCVSEVAITATISGDATMGGLISHVHGGDTYIRGCVFKGKLLGSSSYCVGGFIGWTDHGSADSYFYDCVFAPSQVNVGTTNSATFSRGNNTNSSGIHVYNSFYTQTINTTQGSKLQYTITAGNNVSTVALGNNPVEYNLSGITGYNSSSGYGIKYNNTIYAASGNSVKLNLSSTLANPQYSASAGSLSGTSNPYTLSMTSSNTVISATDGGSSGGGDGDCEDFESVTAVSSASTAGNMPDGWDYIYTGSSTGYRPKVYNSTSSYYPSGLASAIGNNRLMMIAGSSSSYGENTYVILPNYNSVITGISFNAWREHADYGTLYFGYITNASDASTFHQLYQLTTVAYGNATASNASFSYDNLSIPTGARLAFRWNHTSSWYSAFIDNVCVTTVAGPASLPYTEDFENGQNGWEFGNGTQTNYWMVGSNTSYSSSNSLYITNNGSANTYSNSTSYVYAYRKLNIPSAGDYIVSFKWKAYGESTWDLLRAFMIPASVNPTLTGGQANNMSGSGNTTPANWIDVANPSGKLNLQTSWQSSEKNVNLSTAGVYYLVFFWKNDGSGGSTPPAAVDDIDVHLPPITEIATVEDWNAFCAAVNGGYNYSGETVTMTADITDAVTTMAGTSSNPFKGTFDGKGHTLNVNLSSSSEGFVAPFHYVTGATIKNLQVTGSCVSSASGNTRRHNAGLVGSVVATGVTVENCLVTANVGSTSYKTDYCGGLIGHGHDGNIIIKGSVYTGTLYVSGTNVVGGLLGWADTPSAVTITDCFFGGTYSNTDSGWFHPIGVANHANNISSINVSISNCYYTTDPSNFASQNTDKPIVVNSTNKGKHAYTITGGSNVTVTNAGTATTYGGSTTSVHYITGYGTGIKFNNVLYAGQSDDVRLTLTGASEYEADYGTLTSSGNSYTLAMPNRDVVISGLNCATPTAFTYTALGSTYVTLTWTAGDEEEEWQVKYWANGDTEPADGQARSYSVTTDTITGLTLGVTYHAKVRAVCDAQNNEYSDWVQCDFTTSNKTFTNNSSFGDHNWSDPSNWNPIGVPTTDDDVTIAANVTIGNGVLAQAHKITNNATITIADGGQLWHNNTGVNLTIERAIAAYHQSNAQTNLGYKIISFPVSNLKPNSQYITGLLTSDPNHYDFYTFDYANQGEDDRYLEWMPVIAHYSNLGMDSYTGYLYASQEGTTIRVTGAVAPSSANSTYEFYEETGNEPFNGWYMVGNPFVCNAYLTANGDNLDFYEIEDYTQSGYAEFVLNDNTVAIPPMGGVMVRVHEDDYLVYSRTAPTNSKGGILNVDVNKVLSSKDGASTETIDRARLRFGEGRNLEKLQLNPRHTKLYIPEGSKDYSVVYTEGAGSMPVNFKAENNGHYTLSFSTEDVNFNYLHLIDNMTGADIDLLATPTYTFNAKTTDYESRFKLVFAASDVDGSSTSSETFAFYSNGVWVINNEGDATLQVIDVLGHVLSTDRISGATTKAINAASGIYMLRLINGDNVRVQKIVVR